PPTTPLFPYTTLFRSRPPRQPPRAVGGRVAREPVPGRPDADGAGGQGADVDLRHHQPDAARPDQRQASLGGGQGVLRLVPALAVDRKSTRLNSSHVAI